MSELDDAGTYYDLGPRKVTMRGEFHYMCTRNNNFSNRSQKGRIVCGDEIVTDKSIGWNGGNVEISDGYECNNLASGSSFNKHPAMFYHFLFQ